MWIRKHARRWSGLFIAAAAIGALACASTRFVSSWTAPGASPLQVEGSRVAAVAMMEGEASRRLAEDTLARELRERGADGIPMYEILPRARSKEESVVREALERENVQGLVVMRPVDVRQEILATPATFSEPFYRGYWDSYYPYGWSRSWNPGSVRTNTIVSIETLVYSLPQNRLVWGGRSRTTNPSSVRELVAEVADAAAQELRSRDLIASD